MFSILLVDDERTEREGVSFLLQKGGYPFEVFQAANGKRAWEFLQRQPVDVLLTDVKMPFMDGLELSRMVRDYFPDTIIIVFSAYGEFEYAKRAMEAQAIHYLLKPVEVDEFHELMAHVTKLCDEKTTRKALRQKQQQNDRELMLMQLLSGAPMLPDKDALRLCGLSLDDRYLRLVHIETASDYFTRHKESFLKLVDALAPCECMTVSFMPSATYLLLVSRTIIKDEAVAHCAQQLCKEMRRMHGETASAICGASLRGADALAKEAALLIRFRRRMYTAQGSVLFVHDDQAQDSLASADIEIIRSMLATAIERRDFPEIQKHLLTLFAALGKSRTLDNTYLYHILYDLVTRLYVRFERYSGKAVSQRMEEMLDCADLKPIETKMLEVIQSLEAMAQPPLDDDAVGAVKKALRIIHREYAGVLSLDYLAERTGITPSYLSALFKHEMGESPVKYITDYRLKQARRLLQAGGMKINQVAKACGYENTSYFNRIFKAHFGVTPSEIRTQEDTGV